MTQDAIDPQEGNGLFDSIRDYNEDDEIFFFACDVLFFFNENAPSVENPTNAYAVPLQVANQVVSDSDIILTESRILLPDHLLSSLNPKKCIILYYPEVAEDQTPAPFQQIRRPGRYNTSPYIYSWQQY